MQARAAESRLPPDLDRLYLDDLYLATACALGDSAAWEEMEDRFFGFIRALAGRFDLRREAAADVADQVIADLWGRRNIERFEGRSTLKTWLGALVTNAALNAAAGERRKMELDVDGGVASTAASREEADPGPEATSQRAVAGAVAAALKSLPFRDRFFILLYYEQGLTMDQIGSVQGLSKATVSRSLKQVRSRLRKDIEQSLAGTGTSWRRIRPDIDLSQLDLDLPSLLARVHGTRSA